MGWCFIKKLLYTNHCSDTWKPNIHRRYQLLILNARRRKQIFWRFHFGDYRQSREFVRTYWPIMFTGSYLNLSYENIVPDNAMYILVNWYVSTHWGRVPHECVNNLITIGSDNGLSPGRHQAIIWPNAVILLIGPSGTNVSEILIEIHTFSSKVTFLKKWSRK